MYQSDKEQEKKEILKLYKRILGSYNYSLSLCGYLFNSTILIM